MNDLKDTANSVFTWYQRNWNSPVFPFFRCPVVTLETSLSTGKYPWAKDDAREILKQYFDEFGVDKRLFSFAKYWPNEEVFMPLNALRSKEEAWKWVEPAPLTLEMLIESARVGHWLSD